MTWRIEVKPAAERQYLRLDASTRRRIKTALAGLEVVENPFQYNHVRPLTGALKGDCRLRVGNWRNLFTPDREAGTLHVYAILPRGDAY